MKESELQKQCNDYLRSKGVLFYHREKGRSHKQTAHSIGLPDLLIWLPKGRFVAVELKIEGGKVRPEQTLCLQAFNYLGYTSYLVYNFQEFKIIVDNRMDS